MIIDTGYQVPENPDTLITHRILADSENRLWIFFQTSYRSLAFGTSGDGGLTWSPAREILPDVSGPFSAAAGSGGSVHIVAKRSHPPDIHLVTWNGKAWSGGLVLPASGKQLVAGHPLVLEDGKSQVHVLYAVRPYSSGEWQVKHSVVDLARQEINPRAVPAISACQPQWPERLGFLKEVLFWSGDVTRDSLNNLHLVCRAFSESHYQIHYSRCNTGSVEWQGFMPLTRTPFHRGHPKIITGSGEGVIHVIFQTEEEKGDYLSCLSRDVNGRWDTERILDGGIEKDFSPEPVKTNWGPVVYWTGGEGLRRAFVESTGPVKVVLEEKVTGLSAVFAQKKVFLACIGLRQSKNTIFISTDNLMEK